MNTEEEHGDGSGTQPVVTSYGGDLSEKRDHNHKQVLNRVNKAAIEAVLGELCVQL